MAMVLLASLGIRVQEDLLASQMLRANIRGSLENVPAVKHVTSLASTAKPPSPTHALHEHAYAHSLLTHI